jgi:hypothetical protein
MAAAAASAWRRGAVLAGEELKHHVNEPGFRQAPRTMSAIGG